MRDEYLWDKKGSDPDIERLESALMTYRYRESPVPKLPLVQESAEKKRPFFFGLSLAFASAACLIVIAVLAVWLGLLRNGSIPGVQIARTGSTEAFPEANKNERADIEKRTEETPISAPVKIVARQHRSPRNRVAITFAKRNSKRDFAPLTKDERYAYGQLRLALWIAGTKAKVVQDTIDRVGEQRSQAARNEK